MGITPSRRTIAAGLGIALAIVAAVVFLSQRSEEEEQGEVSQGVLSRSLEAARALQSYEVQVEGEVSQGSAKATYKVAYEFVSPDNLRWTSESTLSSRTERAAILAAGGRWWALDGQTWSEQPPLAQDPRALSAERLWRLVPFDSARTTGKVEDVGGFKAVRYRASLSSHLLLEFVAGYLVASEDTPFEGELRDFQIDFWTDEAAGYPVQMKLVATGSDRRLTLNARLVRVNDPSIKIEPPEGARPLSSAAAAAATTVTGQAAAAAATSAASRPNAAASPATAQPQAAAPTSPPPATAQPQAAAPTAAQPTSPPPATAPPTTAPPTTAPPTTAPAAPAPPTVAPAQAAASQAATTPATQTGVQPAASAAQGAPGPRPLPSAGSGGMLEAGPRPELLALGAALTIASLVLASRTIAPEPATARARPSPPPSRPRRRQALLAAAELALVALIVLSQRN